MRSQKGMSLIRFVILMLVLILITGVTVYVAYLNLDNYENQLKNKVNNSVNAENSSINQ